MTDPNAQPQYEPGGGQPGQQPVGTPAPPLTAAQDKQWAMWAHLGGAIAFLGAFWGWISLLAIIPSLVIFLAMGKRGTLTKQESKEALNFQITTVAAIIIWSIISGIVRATLGVAVLFSGGVFALLGIMMIFSVVGWLLVAYDVVFSIIGAVRVNAGGSHRYPFAIRFIK